MLPKSSVYPCFSAASSRAEGYHVQPFLPQNRSDFSVRDGVVASALADF